MAVGRLGELSATANCHHVLLSHDGWHASNLSASQPKAGFLFKAKVTAPPRTCQEGRQEGRQEDEEGQEVTCSSPLACVVVLCHHAAPGVLSDVTPPLHHRGLIAFKKIFVLPCAVINTGD